MGQKVGRPAGLAVLLVPSGVGRRICKDRATWQGTNRKVLTGQRGRVPYHCGTNDTVGKGQRPRRSRALGIGGARTTDLWHTHHQRTGRQGSCQP